MRMNSELIMIDMLLLKPYSLKNVYYSVLHSLPYDPSCQSTFPEVSSLSTICSYEACSITAAIVNASRVIPVFHICTARYLAHHRYSISTQIRRNKGRDAACRREILLS